MQKTQFFTLDLCVMVLSTSCLGSFSAFNSLKDWNSQVSNNKFVNNLLFWGLNIMPVYPLFFLRDTLIFNVIEFWPGSNPIAMEAGEVETQTIVKNGNTYEMTASKNSLKVTVIKGPDTGNTADLFYLPEEKSWNARTPEGEVIKLSSMEEGFYMVYLPDGREVKMNPTTTKEQGLAIINSKLANCDTYFAFAQ